MARQLAFPGAEGFGAYSAGGRGGDVYHVTRLADSGAGSLRYGIQSADGPRTIVFDISGNIILKSDLKIDKPKITIAGQTAPGDGICISNSSMIIKGAEDVIVRYIRIRRGDVLVRAAGRPKGSSGLDTVSIEDSDNIIFDHVSLSWSCDEIFGVVGNRNVTIQWCIISEPLGDPALHPYGNNHAFGVNASASTLSIHHCLFANYVMRGPQFEANDASDGQGYDVCMEAVNNVLFDYKQSGSRYTTGIESNPERASQIKFLFHFVGNTYICKGSKRLLQEIQAETKHGVTDHVKVYVSGNIGPNRAGDELGQWLCVFARKGPNVHDANENIKSQLSNKALFVSSVPVATHSAKKAFELVMDDAGCSIKRDKVDQRVIENVMKRNFSDYLRSQKEVGGWPELESLAGPADTDGDGMPDPWERQKGLDPKDSADGAKDRDGDGYTNLEEYLNWLPISKGSIIKAD